MLFKFANSIIIEDFRENHKPTSWYRAVFYLKAVIRLPVDTIGGYQPYPTGEGPKAKQDEGNRRVKY